MSNINKILHDCLFCVSPYSQTINTKKLISLFNLSPYNGIRDKWSISKYVYEYAVKENKVKEALNALPFPDTTYTKYTFNSWHYRNEGGRNTLFWIDAVLMPTKYIQWINRC